MRVETIDPVFDPRWDSYVLQHPYGCVFHHSAWKDVLEKSFPQVRPRYFVASDDDSGLRGVLPCVMVDSRLTGKRLVSLPFSLYCDPLTDSPETFHAMKEAVCDRYRMEKARFVVFRVRFDPSRFQTGEFHDFVGYKNHTLSLEPDPEQLMLSFHRKSIQKHIHKAEMANLRITQAESEDDIKRFFAVNVRTRKKFGTPPQPYAFFKNMWDILAPRGMLMVHLAWYEAEPVGGLLCLKFKDRVHAEYIGVDERFQSMSPNILLFWRAILAARQDGYRFFEFGGTVSSNE
ncbi:MAG TPA: GNAT family N-acetyltransferase, partial [bacterium]